MVIGNDTGVDWASVRLEALAELNEKTHDLDDPADVAYAAAEILGRKLGVNRAGYGTIDPEAETIVIERDWNAPGIRSLAGKLHFRDYGSYIEDLKRGETVVFSDAEKDPRTAATADALKAISAQSVVNMPIRERGGLVALLYLNHATAREWAPEELELIRDVQSEPDLWSSGAASSRSFAKAMIGFEPSSRMPPSGCSKSTPTGAFARPMLPTAR